MLHQHARLDLLTYRLLAERLESLMAFSFGRGVGALSELERPVSVSERLKVLARSQELNSCEPVLSLYPGFVLLSLVLASRQLSQRDLIRLPHKQVAVDFLCLLPLRDSQSKPKPRVTVWIVLDPLVPFDVLDVSQFNRTEARVLLRSRLQLNIELQCFQGQIGHHKFGLVVARQSNLALFQAFSFPLCMHDSLNLEQLA